LAIAEAFGMSKVLKTEAVRWLLKNSKHGGFSGCQECGEEGCRDAVPVFAASIRFGSLIGAI
jgi:hypothetical protein